jgi:RNA polymerase sigma factor (sigma-70 family)
MAETMSCSDEERKLIEGCKRGDRKAQKQLYDKFAPKMLVVCERFMGNRDAAQDILQDGFVTVFSKLDSYSGTGSLEGWIRKIMTNTALCELRKNDVMNDAQDIDVTYEAREIGFTDVMENMAAKDLLNLIMTMPAGYRAVFNLSVFEGMSHAQIAKALGITEANSRSQLSRGKAWLQEKIKKLGMTDGRI